MIPFRCSLPRELPWLPIFLLCLAFALLPAVPSAAQKPGESKTLVAGEKSSRQKQIEELERQIRELTKKLEELRKKPEVRPPQTPSPLEDILPPSWVKSFRWRAIGPASMGGRIVALSVYEKDPSIWWVATASGGLLKTTNNGVTFRHQFDHENTVSVGDVCVAPSNPEIVWVGTGEHNPRNSVSYGDGVYKSTDGGKTWKHMGLKKSFQIGRIAIHPTNPNIVYVGAMGRLYGPNTERGLFKTTDGGKTWNKSLYVDDTTGVIEVQMHPNKPDTLLVATWECQRDAFDSHAGATSGQSGSKSKLNPALAEGYDAYDPIKKWGKGSAIHKTTDGGKTWQKLSKGLPTCKMGRVGLDYFRKNPDIVFAVIDTEKIGMGTPPSRAYLGAQLDQVDKEGGVKVVRVLDNSPAAKAGLKANDVIVALDGKPLKTVPQLLQAFRTRKPGDKVKFRVQRGKETKEWTVTLGERRRRVRIDFRAESAPGGVRITRVTPEGSSAKAGLRVGDILVAVDRKPVTGIRDLFRMFASRQPGDKLLLRVKRGKETKQLPLVMEPRDPTPNRPWGERLGGQQPNVQQLQGPNSHEYGGVYQSTDGGESWTRINSANPRPMYFSQVRVDPQDEQTVWLLGVYLRRSTNGGKTFTDFNRSIHPDQHALWIDPRDGRHLILGTDGGFYTSYDRGQHWDFHNDVAIGQFYHVCVDNRRPYHVYGGLQDNGSWGGPSRSLDGEGPVNHDWILLGGGDGFVCRVDRQEPDVVYYESQNGNIRWRNLRTGERGAARPRSPQGQPPYRFNWNTPYILSAHNSRVFYSAGNRVFRSVNRTENLQVLSPEITRTGKGSATALAESPLNPTVLWVGTDDGYLWVTQDGGKKWTNVAGNVGYRPKSGVVAGQEHLPWVATIEASRYAEARAYVCCDAHRSDDDNPHVYVTEDFGKTWKPIRANLPWGSTRCLREDPIHPSLLYCGTEFAVWASINRGKSWTKINNNLPTVAVHELALHPTAGEMVAATHGRSLWILDVTPLRQMHSKMLKDAVTLFQPATTVRWQSKPRRGTIYGTGHRGFVGQNPPGGAQFYYALGQPAKAVRVQILDYTGKSVRELKVKPGSKETKPGLHRLTWDLRGRRDRTAGDINVFLPFTRRGLIPAIPPRLIARRGRPRTTTMPAGMYRVVLKVDDREFTQSLRIENDPNMPRGTTGVDQEE